MLSIVTWRSAVLVSAICPSCSVSSHSARLCALAVCCNIARLPSLLHLPHVFVDRSCHAHVLKEHTRQQQRATTSERRGECVARHRSPPSLSSPAERHRHTGRQAASQASKQASKQACMRAGGSARRLSARASHLLRQAARVVRGQRDLDAVVHVEPLGVVVRLLRQQRHARHEPPRLTAAAAAASERASEPQAKGQQASPVAIGRLVVSSLPAV